MIRVYFLWFDYWTLKKWKTLQVQKHSVASYLHKCLVHFLICLRCYACFYFYFILFIYLFFEGEEITKCRTRTTSLEQHYIPFDSLAHSMLTKLTGNGECWLAPFHLIRNVLANNVSIFQGCSNKQDAILLGQPAPYHQLFIPPFRSWDYSENFGIYSQLDRKGKSLFFTLFDVYVFWIGRDKS